jgi:hypothetical protein
VVVLNAGWGCSTAEEGGKRKGEDLPQDLLGLLPSRVSRGYRTRVWAGVLERAEGGGVAAGLVLLLVGLQRKEREERREGIGAFGQNSIEF